MTRSVIDPVTRIEGHLRVEMEVENGKVSDAWVSGGCFRGIELVVENRTPEDAAQIVQRICGVCPVSHAHASSIAAEKAYGITISNNARIIRNIQEGAQFLHSHILWFYNLAGLDYVNPLNALKANPADAMDLARAAGTSMNSDFVALKEHLSQFAENGQLSIFSGNWFDAEDGTGFKLPPELDLICTAHYLEALGMQAKASQISALLGGKMPHVMTLRPGGTAFVPTDQKLDDLKLLVDELYNWVEATMIPDVLAIAPYYADAFGYGKGPGRYIAWGVFEREDFKMSNRYLPSGVLDENLNLSEPDEKAIAEWVGRSWYKGSETYQAPNFTTEPEYTDYNVNDRYTWVKCPTYNGNSMEATSLSRVLAAYKRNVPFVKEHVDAFLKALGHEGDLSVAQSTLGPAWRPLPQRVGQGRQDPGLPDHHPVHVEPGSEEREGPARSARGGSDRRAGGRYREAHQRAAHGALLRPLHGLLGSYLRACHGQAFRNRHEPLGGEVTWRIWHTIVKLIRCRS